MGGLIASLIVGGIAGWLAGMIMKGKGLGILMNIVVGIIGGRTGWLVIRTVRHQPGRGYGRFCDHRNHRRRYPAVDYQ